MKNWVMVVLVIFLFSCVTVGSNKKQSGPIEGVAGRPIGSYALTIDANYDPRLDHLVKGYKFLPMTIRNQSLVAIPMSVEKDRWVIVSETGKKMPALNSLKLKEAALWRRLPEDFRSAVDYPEVVPINYTATFDLVFSAKANLSYFTEIRYYNAAFDREFILKKEY